MSYGRRRERKSRLFLYENIYKIDLFHEFKILHDERSVSWTDARRDGFCAAEEKIKMERGGMYVTFLRRNSSSNGRSP